MHTDPFERLRQQITNRLMAPATVNAEPTNVANSLISERHFALHCKQYRGQLDKRLNELFYKYAIRTWSSPTIRVFAEFLEQQLPEFKVEIGIPWSDAGALYGTNTIILSRKAGAGADESLLILILRGDIVEIYVSPDDLTTTEDDVLLATHELSDPTCFEALLTTIWNII